MVTNTILPTLFSWFFFFCHCFFSFSHVTEAMFSQKFYQFHYEFSDSRQCKWFLEAAEALCRQQTIQATIRAMQHEFEQTKKAR